ncbi:MAG: hypothetical protein HYS68_00730 [Candidatus Levybacteria bacterium]|nr:hypothetical protein [Candidatus Levybacteria bacterium]
MARRKTILATNEVYHVYNRGVEKRPIFILKKDYLRFLELINYYQFTDCPLKFSYFVRLPLEERLNTLKKLQSESKKLVDIFAFCFMPERTGYLFQGNFGAVRIETNEQLIHVSRYIHLNPVSSYLVEIKDLENYEYSSYPEYLDIRSGFSNVEEVLSFFKNGQEYKNFVEDQADYARQLENIKHLTLE